MAKVIIEKLSESEIKKEIFIIGQFGRKKSHALIGNTAATKNA